MSRKYAETSQSHHEEDEADKEAVAQKAGETATAQEIDTSGIDDMLKDIDDVLEQNAEAFVEGFVQRGGQ